MSDQLPLEFDDYVTFTVKGVSYRYRVGADHLYLPDRCNDAIFVALGMVGGQDNAQKHQFCSAAYGYPAGFGWWPTCQRGDYAALTRLVKAISARISPPNPEQDFLF